MDRRLSPKFLSDLKAKDGLLAPILQRVKADPSLCLEIRKDVVNIYYRGGNVLQLTLRGTAYDAWFDIKYFRGAPSPELPPRISRASHAEKWLNSMPSLKHAMDSFPKRQWEREVQQLIVGDNNFRGIARSTDFYICDIEYQAGSGRYDLVAVNWPSTSAQRKQQQGHRLVIGEVKYGDSALANSSGLLKHVRDVQKHLAKPKAVENLKREMALIFNQKRSLGLIKCQKDLLGFSDDPVMLLLLLANHDPDASRLRDLLQQLHALPPCLHSELYIASACLLGYGLYDPAILPVDQALQQLGNRI